MDEESSEHHQYEGNEGYGLQHQATNLENVPVSEEYMAVPYNQPPILDTILSQPLKWRKIVAADGAIPRPRHGHKSVIVNDNMLIWGGGNEGIIDEITVYNIPTNRWSTPNTRGDKPPGTAASGLTKGPGSRIYTFGGMIEYGQYSNDLYELDLTRWEWRKLRARARPGLGQQAVQPCARLGHSLVSDSKGMLYIFGGLTNGSEEARFNKPKYLNDFYCVNVSQTHMNQGVVYWEQPRTKGPQPPCRESHTAVILETATRREMILYGGMDGNRLGDIWVIDLNKMEWQEKLCFGSAPLPRSLHCAALLGDKMYIYGGWVPIGEAQPNQRQDARWKCTSSLGVLNCSTWTWELANLESITESYQEGQETFPHARSGHSSSVFGKRIYVWSGRDGYRKAWNNQVCCRDFWYLETEKPAKPVRLNLGKANLKALDVFWSPVKNAEAYLLQILKNPPTQFPRKLIKPAPKPVKPTVKKDEDMPENFMEDVAEEKEPKEEQQQPETEEKEVEEEWMDVAIVKGTTFTVTEYYEKNSELPRLGESYTRTDIHDSYQLQRKVHEIEQGTGYRIRVAGVNLLGIGEFSDPVMFKTILPGFPGAPSQIKIQKVAEGAQICWIPPAIPNGRIVEYSVYLAMKPGDRVAATKLVSKQSASPSMPGVEFERVYVGDRTECFIDHKVILEAHVESNIKNKPAVIFRIAAKNEKGYGPATQVRWLQDWRTDLDFNNIPVTGPPRVVGQPMKTVVRAPGTPVTLVRTQNARPMVPGQGPVVARGPQMVYRAAQPTSGVRYQPYNASGAQGSVAPRIVAIPPHRQLAGQQVRIQPHPGQNPNQQR